MRRITIAMNDDLYLTLLDYAADESKLNVRRLSMGKAVRVLMSSRLEQLGYQTNARRTTLIDSPRHSGA